MQLPCCLALALKSKILEEDYEESRFRYFGFLKGFMVLVVYSPRPDSYRIISMRKATPNEEESVHKYLYG